ncbi:MAG: flagellar motor protein MotB [Ruminococcus sp.]|nr:flagellar motor protein MotB [Ruminococcus sp.]
MKKRPKSSGGGANWMDTYGDLVTLLLCFFVLLYSISTIDQAKWIQIVKSFNPDAKEVSQIAENPDVDANDEVPGGVEADEFDGLYEALLKAIQEAGLEGEVELYKGDGYTFITFQDNVFFDGDSSIIKEEGKSILTTFSNIVAGVSDSIKEIQVLGHTTQADPNQMNEPESDRVLSAERAARVVAFIQQRTTVPADRMVAVGYGQFRPIAPFDTAENRAKNRRVELLITKSDAVQHSLEEYYQEMNR